MVFPLIWKIVAVALAKKATVYVLGRMYGYPRVYRRFLEFNRWYALDKPRRIVLQEKVKYFFRVPNQLAGWFWRRRTP